MQYSDDDLVSEVRSEISRNARFRRDVEEAIRRKNRSWLTNLIIDVAKAIWGFVKDSIIGRVVRFFLGG